MLSSPHGQGGVTLVELMIASLLALFALAAVVTAYSATSGHAVQYLHRAHLRQQLHTLMHAMVRDLRRAGYWSFDPRLRPATDNPFQNDTNRLSIHAYPGEAPNSCILFAYDLDRDGRVGVGRCPAGGCSEETDSDNVEQFGYRLRDGLVQARYGGSSFSCDAGHWQSLTDPDIAIARLEFTRHAVCTNLSDAHAACRSDAPGLVERAVEVRLSGHRRSRPGTTITLPRWLGIRNDRLLEGAPDETPDEAS